MLIPRGWQDNSWPGPVRPPGRGGNQHGGVLLGVVAAMLMAGVLGAGAASMLSTSSLHGVRANFGERAYYLAESGYRYAASVLRTDQTEEREEFWGLDGEQFEVPGGGRFTLQLAKLTEDEDYDTAYQVEGNQSVELHGTLNLAEGAALAPINGLFVHQGSWYRYREFREDGLVDIIAAPDNQRQVAAAQTVDEGGNLSLLTGSAVPPAGQFRYNGTTYAYASLSGNVLQNITGGSFPLTVNDGDLLGFPALFPLVVDDGESIDFASIIEVRATGEYPGDESDLNVARTVTYWFYTADGFPGEMPADDDGFVGDGEIVASDMDNFIEGPGSSHTLGKYEEEVVDGAPAIRLKEMNPGGQHPMTSLLFGSVSSADYEVQVKIKVDELDPVAYMAGITFRFQGGNNNPGQLGQGLYGVSIAKGADGAAGNNAPPSSLTSDTNNEPIIVLWTLDGNPNNTDPVRLAWTSIDSTSIVDGNGRLKDWSTLLVRVRQLGEPGEEDNRIQVLYGDHIVESSSGDSDAYNDARITSPRGGFDHDGSPVLPWPPNDFGAWSAGVDHFTVTAIDETDATFLYEPGAVAEVGLHTWGQNLAVCEGRGSKATCDGKVSFDDFGLREAGQGGDGGGTMYGGGFIPPIQQ